MGIETPLLKSAHKISQLLRPRAEIWRAWSDLPSSSGESPREATGNGSSPWGHIHRWWAFREPLLPCGHWCWRASFWNPPSSLLASRWPGLAQRAVDTNTRMPQVMQLTGQNPTHQQTGCPMNFWPYSCPGHGPAHKMGQDIAPHSIAQILDPGTARALQGLGPRTSRALQPEIQTQFHQGAGTHPRISWAPALSTTKPVHPSGPALPTSRQTLASGQPQASRQLW